MLLEEFCHDLFALQLFLLEERREKKFDHYARVLQKAFKRYFNQKKLLREKEEASDIFYQRKERRRHSLNRNFYGDYLGLEDKAGVRALVGKRDRVEFAQTVARHEKKFKVRGTYHLLCDQRTTEAFLFVQGVKTQMRDLVVTQKGIFLVGRETEKSGPNKVDP